jgi:hypothetical protein
VVGIYNAKKLHTSLALNNEETRLTQPGKVSLQSLTQHEIFLTRSYIGSDYSCNSLPLSTWSLALALALALLALRVQIAHTDAFNTNALWPPRRSIVN